MNEDQTSILLAEVERLARKMQEMRRLDPDAMFYGLPLWVQVVSPAAIEIVAKGNPLWNEFRAAIEDAFFSSQEGEPD